MRSKCKVHSDSVQLPLDLQKKHYSHCTPCICYSESTSGNNLKIAIKEAPTEVLHTKIAEQGCYVDLVKVILEKITEIMSLENPPVNVNEQIDMINTVVEFIKAKHIKPSCKKLPEDTMSFDFNTALQDETIINSAREVTENAKPVEDVGKEWQEQLNAVNRGRKKDKIREMLERKWDDFITYKLPKDSETSSVISYKSNATETMTQRPPATRYGADIAKEVLDNILVFDDKQGEFRQFLSTIELYLIMYRVCKVDLLMLHSRHTRSSAMQ